MFNRKVNILYKKKKKYGEYIVVYSPLLLYKIKKFSILYDKKYIKGAIFL